HMLAVRAGFVAVTACAGYLGVRVQPSLRGQLLILSGLYLLLSFAVEGLRRSSGARGLFLIGVTLLIDGVYLAWAMYVSGGPGSPLSFLLYLHLIAVTLLASFRTGLKIALWHSLLLFVGFYAQLAGLLDPVGETTRNPDQVVAHFRNVSVYYVLAFWVVAIATVAFSSLNERELRRRGLDLEALSAMAAELDNATKSSSAAECLAESLREAFNFQRVAVLFARDGELVIGAQQGCANLTTGVHRQVDSSIESAWRERTSVIRSRPSSEADPRLAGLFPDAKRLLVVPLLVEGERIGVVAAEESSNRRYRIDSRVRPMVEQFASHAALAVSNVRLLEQLQVMADTDPLTGIANRLMFDRTLHKEVSRADRSGGTLGLLLLDIDHFKALNDTHGHQVGDDVLRQIALALTDHSRSFDTVARYGGEEFVVIVPSAGVEECLEVAERLREEIATLPLAAPVTASLGLALYPLHADGVDALVRAADDALYVSKKEGRNRVTLTTGTFASI
ncbi:MAG: sensor domain-containing diguanylate cyclase, partial [Actinobacteria bacterium]|nr:sensor domain-containing diguanylate cyclase [Actinomycetota bacterium]